MTVFLVHEETVVGLGTISFYRAQKPVAVMFCRPSKLSELAQEAIRIHEGAYAGKGFNAHDPDRVKAEPFPLGKKPRDPDAPRLYSMWLREDARSETSCRVGLWNHKGDTFLNVFTKTPYHDAVFGQVWISADGQIAYDQYRVGLLTVRSDLNRAKIARTRPLGFLKNLLPEFNPARLRRSEQEKLAQLRQALAHRLVEERLLHKQTTASQVATHTMVGIPHGFLKQQSAA